MKDVVGNELHVGDDVVICEYQRTSAHLAIGTVIGFTPKKVLVRRQDWEEIKSPSKLARYYKEE